MKYEKCLSCGQLGNTCDGPNFLAMDAVELGKWCDEKRKLIPGMTYDRIVAETNVSKSAAYGFLKGTHTDCRIETIRPIVKLLTGGKWDDNPCGNVESSERAAYEAKVQELERELKWHEDKLRHYEKENQRAIEDHEKTKTTHATNLEFWRKEMNRKNRIISILSWAVAGLFVAIIITLLFKK